MLFHYCICGRYQKNILFRLCWLLILFILLFFKKFLAFVHNNGAIVRTHTYTVTLLCLWFFFLEVLCVGLVRCFIVILNKIAVSLSLDPLYQNE